jgi:hypothetical protein
MKQQQLYHTRTNQHTKASSARDTCAPLKRTQKTEADGSTDGAKKHH